MKRSEILLDFHNLLRYNKCELNEMFTIQRNVEGGAMMREWLRDIRTSSGVTQTAVAQKVGLSCQMYNYIESGKRNPSAKVARRIAVLLVFPHEWYRLLSDEDDEDGMSEGSMSIPEDKSRS